MSAVGTECISKQYYTVQCTCNNFPNSWCDIINPSEVMYVCWNSQCFNSHFCKSVPFASEELSHSQYESHTQSIAFVNNLSRL